MQAPIILCVYPKSSLIKTFSNGGPAIRSLTQLKPFVRRTKTNFIKQMQNFVAFVSELVAKYKLLEKQTQQINILKFSDIYFA